MALVTGACFTCRRALEEVKHDLTERQYRWQQIEMMCNFSVMSNPGLKALIQSTGHTDLYRFSHGGLYCSEKTTPSFGLARLFLRRGQMNFYCRAFPQNTQHILLKGFKYSIKLFKHLLGTFKNSNSCFVMFTMLTIS